MPGSRPKVEVMPMQCMCRTNQWGFIYPAKSTQSLCCRQKVLPQESAMAAPSPIILAIYGIWAPSPSPQKQIFERRLALHPVFMDEDGTLHANTKFGDYPMILPNKKINSFEEIFPGWMFSPQQEACHRRWIRCLPPT